MVCQIGRSGRMNTPAPTVTPACPSRRATARVKDPLPVPAECPHCAGAIGLVSNAAIYGREFGEWPFAYLCASADCGAYVGLHPFTALPLGTLATAPMREARKRAKAAFNPLWQSGRMRRAEAYQWLADELGIEASRCHIGMFDVAQCEATVAAIDPAPKGEPNA